MNVSVIICTCNRYDPIKRTIESILANTVKPLELIVVDQSDNHERVKSILNSCNSAVPIKYVSDDRKGLSKARNKGIENSRGDIILFTDDDTIVDHNWIKNTVKTFELKEYNTGIVGGKIIPVYEEVNRNWKMPKCWEHFLPAIDFDCEMGNFKKGLPAGANIAFNKKVFEAAGKFDENLGLNASRKIQLYGEDSDLVLNAKKNGFDILYNPDSIVYHPVPLSRQSQGYLNNRCFCEGATRQYMKLKRRGWKKKYFLYSFFWILYDAVKIILSQSRIDKSAYEGHMHFIKGRLYMFFKWKEFQ